MLAYAYQDLQIQGYDSVSVEKFESALDLLATIVSHAVSAQIKRGLMKEYISISEPMNSPKGKIKISQSIPLYATHSKQLICEHDEFSANIYPNQIIKSTLRLLVKSSDVPQATKKIIKRSLLYFEGIDDIRITSINWQSIRIGKTNSSYKALLSLCYIICTGMIQSTEAGHVRLNTYIDEQRMSRLYEQFILRYYQKHYPQLKPAAPYVAWNVDDGYTYLLPVMKTDTILFSGPHKLIIDAKYYQHTMQTNTRFNNKTLHSNNLYQMYSYVKNLDTNHTGNVSGLLLYAKTDELLIPDNVYTIDGSKITVTTLDLNQDFSGIEMQLQAIADNFLSNNSFRN